MRRGGVVVTQRCKTLLDSYGACNDKDVGRYWLQDQDAINVLNGVRNFSGKVWPCNARSVEDCSRKLSIHFSRHL